MIPPAQPRAQLQASAPAQLAHGRAPVRSAARVSARLWQAGAASFPKCSLVYDVRPAHAHTHYLRRAYGGGRHGVRQRGSAPWGRARSVMRGKESEPMPIFSSANGAHLATGHGIEASSPAQGRNSTQKLSSSLYVLVVVVQHNRKTGRASARPLLQCARPRSLVPTWSPRRAPGQAGWWATRLIWP